MLLSVPGAGRILSWSLLIAAANLLVCVIVRAGRAPSLAINNGLATGIASGTALAWGLSALAPLIITGGLFAARRLVPLSEWAMACAIGGAAANALDRGTHGGVTDFIPIPGTPLVANLADILIVIGVGTTLTQLLVRSSFPHRTRLRPLPDIPWLQLRRLSWRWLSVGMGVALIAGMSVRLSSLPVVTNPGFGGGAIANETVARIATASAVVLLLAALVASMVARAPRTARPLSLLGAGVIANAFERIFLGGVVDFVPLAGWAVINPADLMILSGGLWLLSVVVRHQREVSRLRCTRYSESASSPVSLPATEDAP